MYVWYILYNIIQITYSAEFVFAPQLLLSFRALVLVCQPALGPMH
jgi:hypothetical protein